jgi:excisionase family DNA binding protein
VRADGSPIDVMAEFGILQADEVAELLKLRPSTVLDLSRRGILPAFKIGKHWRYRRADLMEWLMNRPDAA